MIEIEHIIRFVGAFLKHLVGVLLLCWRRMLRAGAVAFGVGVILALLIAVIQTGQAFPGALALVVALLFGAALAYGVAMTVLIEEFLLGVVDLIKMLEGDTKAVAHITTTIGEREVGEIGKGLRRLVGLPLAARAVRVAPIPTLPTLPRYPATSTAMLPATTPATAPAAPAVSPAAATALAAAGTAAAVGSAALAATSASDAVDDAEMDEPPPSASAPVRADRLPRIGWTYEHEAIKLPRPDGASVTTAPAAEPAPAAPPEPPETPETPQAHIVRPAPAPDTLAELAGASLSGLGQIAAQRQTTAAPAVTPAEAQVDAAPLEAASQSASEDASQDASQDVEDAGDERLAEPAALTLPTEPAPATVPLQAEPPRADEAPEAEAQPPAVPAPATTPLMQAEPEPEPLPAPATTPLMQAEPAPATTPFAQPEPAPVPAAAAVDAAGDDDASERASDDAAADAPQAAAAPEPTAEPLAPDTRPAFSRVTRPVSELGGELGGGPTLGAALDALGHTGAASGPRPSAPESGLWERLSQALLDRSGALSGPFAAPQTSHGGAADATDAASASEQPGDQSNGQASEQPGE